MRRQRCLAPATPRTMMVADAPTPPGKRPRRRVEEEFADARCPLCRALLVPCMGRKGPYLACLCPGYTAQ